MVRLLVFPLLLLLAVGAVNHAVALSFRPLHNDLALPSITRRRPQTQGIHECGYHKHQRQFGIINKIRGGGDGATDADTSSSNRSSGGSPNASPSEAPSHSITDLLKLLEPCVDTIQTALISGANIHGVAALTAVATATVLPLALLVKQSYAFVVGCGLATTVMSWAMMSSFGVKQPSFGDEKIPQSLSPPILMAYACVLYGLRLASTSILKDLTTGDKADDMEEKNSIGTYVVLLLKRIPVAINVSILYAFMVSPLLYALRGADRTKSKLGTFTEWLGAAIAYVGMILSAVIDLRKYMIEKNDVGIEEYINERGGMGLSSEGAFNLARHLNYLGEGLFWVGLYLGGMPSFGGDATAWVCGTLGLSGIVVFMFLPWIIHLLLSRINYGHEDAEV